MIEAINDFSHALMALGCVLIAGAAACAFWKARKTARRNYRRAVLHG